MTRAELSAVLMAHYETHRDLTPRDIYKLLYQAVFGPEHSVDNPRAALERLYLEILHLPNTLTTDPLLEPLSPQLCRVNLQPWMQQGGDVRGLWRSFRQTLRDFQPGTLTDLQRGWQFFLATPWAQRYDTASLNQFWQQMATADFAPVHHSREYTAANAPHYRVVLRALMAGPGAA
jgi:hypothetical protein